MPTLSVVIPVHNKWELTAACLRSLAEHTPGGDVAVIVVDNASADDTSEAVQTFLSDYNTAYGEAPNMFSATTYDAAAILCDALKVAEDAGLTAGTDEYKAAVIEAIGNTDGEYVTGHFTYDDNNNPVKDAIIIQIVDGKYTFNCKF